MNIDLSAIIGVQKEPGSDGYLEFVGAHPDFQLSQGQLWKLLWIAHNNGMIQAACKIERRAEHITATSEASIHLIADTDGRQHNGNT